MSEELYNAATAKMNVVFGEQSAEMDCSVTADDASFTVEWGDSYVTPPYEGSYEVTPTQSTQTLATSGYRMTGDVIINPIPSNYGLIEWDGSILTVL